MKNPYIIYFSVFGGLAWGIFSWICTVAVCRLQGASWFIMDQIIALPATLDWYVAIANVPVYRWPGIIGTIGFIIFYVIGPSIIAATIIFLLITVFNLLGAILKRLKHSRSK